MTLLFLLIGFSGCIGSGEENGNGEQGIDPGTGLLEPTSRLAAIQAGDDAGDWFVLVSMHVQTQQELRVTFTPAVFFSAIFPATDLEQPGCSPPQETSTFTGFPSVTSARSVTPGKWVLVAVGQDSFEAEVIASNVSIEAMDNLTVASGVQVAGNSVGPDAVTSSDVQVSVGAPWVAAWTDFRVTPFGIGTGVTTGPGDASVSSGACRIAQAELPPLGTGQFQLQGSAFSATEAGQPDLLGSYSATAGGHSPAGISLQVVAITQSG